MARLPIPGHDAGTWGDILNDFLQTSHNSDGTLKNGAVTGSALGSKSVSKSALNTTNSPSTNQILSYDGTDMAWSDAPSVPVSSVVGQTGAITGAQIANDPTMSAKYTPSYGYGDSNAMYPMRAFAKKMITMDTVASGTHLKWLTCGSSVADVKIREGIGQYVYQSCGGMAGLILGGWGSGSGSFGGGTASFGPLSTTGAGITGRSSDFDIWPSGITSRMNATGSATIGAGGGSPYCDSLEIIYATGPSANGLDGGTFSWRVDSGSETQVSTLATSQGIVRIQIPLTLGAHNLTLTWVSGSVRFIGFSYFNSTTNGMVPMSCSQGGINLYACADQAFTNFSTFLGWYQPDVITLEMKGGQIDAWANTNTPTGAPGLVHFKKWLDAIDSASTDNAGPDVIVYGSTPDQTTFDTQRQLNDYLAIECRSRQPKTNVFVWDGYRVLGDYQHVLALGWHGDGVHMDAKLSRFLAGRVIDDLGLFKTPGIPQPFGKIVPSAATVNGKLEVKRSQDTTKPFSVRAEPTFGYDAQIMLDRWLDITNSDATSTLARFAARNGDSFLPNIFRVGNAAQSPFIRSSGNDLVYVARGSNANQLGLFTAGSYGMQRADTNPANGAISLDLMTGGCQRLFMNGNITSLSVTNLNIDEQLVELWFVNDGSARTVTGISGAIHFAGGSIPSLSVGNGYCDIFVFRGVGGGLYEISRSMAVR